MLVDLLDRDPEAAAILPPRLPAFAQDLAQLAVFKVDPETAITIAEEAHGGIETVVATPAEADAAIRSGLVGPGGVNTGEGDVSEKNVSKVPAAGKNGVIPNLGPTNNVVDVQKMYKTFQFDPDGPGQIEEAIKSPVAGRSAKKAADSFEGRGKELVKQKSLSRQEADVFWHAAWSFEVTRKFGPKIAKKFGDAHERTVVNEDGDRLKDLFNNNAGRVLASDPANRNRPAEEVVLEAIRAGKLQINPMRVPPPPAGILQLRRRPSPI